MKTAMTKPPKSASASALIIAVILTSLLAIIGMMFVMIARVDKMATSAISANKELNFAAEAVVAKISQELVLDVPGIAGAEYCDYPDGNDPWLANLETYDDVAAGKYYWRHISDIYNKFGPVDSGLEAIDKPDYQKPSEVGDSDSTNSYPADADGDGVADSNWVIIPDMNSNKGKPIYAAVRVIDNGAMLNVNTVFANPGGSDTRKGDMLTDIYIDGLVKSGADLITTFLDNRSNAPNASTYYTEAARRIENPDTATNYYRFYDISEELSLRNRYVLLPGQSSPTQPWLSSMTRLESYGPPQCLSTTLRASTYGNSFAPYTSSDFGDWKRRLDPFDVGVGSLPSNNNYDFRHLLTTYNMDRIINPDCNEMNNINTATISELYSSVRKGLIDANCPSSDVNELAAQIAVDMNDYRDSDSDVCVFTSPDDGKTYYGFETPCIYISELAHRAQLKPSAPSSPTFPADYDISYAIELYKPYPGDGALSGWRLTINGLPISLDDWPVNKQYYVIKNENPLVPSFIIDSGAFKKDDPLCTFTDNTLIELQRQVGGVGGTWITVDFNNVPGGWWNTVDNATRSIQRDIATHKCIRRLWASTADVSVNSPTLGKINGYSSPDTGVIQAHPENKPFTNIGEIGMIFRKDVYTDVVRGAVESDVRLNLADPNFQQLFKYLTVFDPNTDGIDNDGDGTVDNGELKIPGRINVNTAPWYVIAQLPWMRPEIAQAIVAYRDKLDLSSTTGGPNYSGLTGRKTETGIIGIYEASGFRSIGELMNVINISGKTNYDMCYYTLGSASGKDLTTFPDLTPNDGAVNDFEERDVIFARLSNLVTVRSDVFTAYILVRIGRDGPQKRVMAILDRSGVRSPTDKVRIIALHPVPDPR
jgi:hypothetical protein